MIDLAVLCIVTIAAIYIVSFVVHIIVAIWTAKIIRDMSKDFDDVWNKKK